MFLYSSLLLLLRSINSFLLTLGSCSPRWQFRGRVEHPAGLVAFLLLRISDTHLHHVYRLAHAYLHRIAIHTAGQDLLFHLCTICWVVGVHPCYRVFCTSLNMAYHLGSFFRLSGFSGYRILKKVAYRIIDQLVSSCFAIIDTSAETIVILMGTNTICGKARLLFFPHGVYFIQVGNGLPP